MITLAFRLAVMAGLLSITASASAMGTAPTVASITTPICADSPNIDQRFGVVVADTVGTDMSSVLNSLCVRTYYKYGWGEPLPGFERIQMVGRTNISEVGLDAFIRSHLGSYWMVGNEPNVPNQDNLSPAAYAQLFHNWAVRIKGLDPTAKILNAGIGNFPDVVGVPGGGLAYIRDFRESHRILFGTYPSVDVWNIHAYPPFFVADGRLQSFCDTSFPKLHISEVARYLRASGEMQPIWLTEFGMDWGNDQDPCVVTFMTDMVGWLATTGLVNRWYWFSLNGQSWGFGGNLVDLAGTPTILGQTYRGLAAMQR
ncbi:MAG: hypothetical protein HY675_04390 [Chloroflexi bacterium]|nr:hypothetical protein [Chloroflexota bacterium]